MLVGYEEIRAAVLDGKLYVVGGRTGEGPSNNCVTTVQVYDPGADQWSYAAPLPAARAAVGLAVVGGYLYCFGGIIEPYWWGVPSNSAYRYNPVGNSWSPMANMPIARSNFVTAVIDGKVYCMGGNVHWPNATNRTDVYDPSGDSWSTITNAPENRGDAVGGAFGGKLVVAYGLRDAYTTRMNALMYDPAGPSWSQPCTTQAQFGAEGGHLFNTSSAMWFGGFKSGAAYQTWLNRYDPATGAVTNVSQAPAARTAGAAAYDPATRTAYFAGGSDAGSNKVVTFEKAVFQGELSWAGTTGYETDGLDPETGEPNSTNFTFKVKYTDLLEEVPQAARCIIQRKDCGGPWQGCVTLPLTIESGDIATGAIYSGTTQLPNTALKYTFRFKTTTVNRVPGDPSGWRQGPLLNARPHLCWYGGPGFGDDGVDPDSGPTGTSFQFEVLYADSAANVPTTHEVVIRRNGAVWHTEEMTPVFGGGNYRFGKRYEASVVIDQPGNYRYHFNFANASGTALGPASGWSPGPEITGSGSPMVTSLAAVPTNAGVQMTFSLSSSANVCATVLNVAGRPIATIVADQPLNAGLQTLLWDRRAQTGLPVPSGLYLVRVTARNADGSTCSALATLALR